MKNCPECGAEFSDDALYCKNCGAKNNEKAEAASEEAQPQMLTEEVKPAKKKKAFVIPVAAGGIVLLTAAGVTAFALGVSPNKKYDEAVKAYEEGNFEAAASQFEAMGDYKDAKERVTQSVILMHYTNGKKAFDEGDYEKAKEEFTAAGDYKDSAAMVKESELGIHYAKAMLNSAYGKKEAAVEELKLAGDFKDSKNMLFDLLVSLGDKAMEDDQADKACEFYKQAEEYKELPSTSKGVAYYRGMKALNASEYEKAIEYFTQAGNVKGSDELLKKCYAGVADDAIAKNDVDRAIKYYSMAGESGKVTGEAAERFYNMAESEYAAGNTEKALSYYALVGDYKDSKTKLQTAGYALGSAAYKKRDYENAISYLSKIGNYKDAQTKLQAAYYQQGLKWYSTRDFYEACECFGKAGNGHKEAMKMFFQSLKSEINRGSYDEARELVDYYPGDDIAKLRSYAEAYILYDRFDYIAAAANFELLGDYRDSKTYCAECYYLYGIKQLESGSYDVAKKSFEKCGKYKFAQDLAKVSEAEYLYKNNKKDEAAELYRKVSGKVKLGEYDNFDVQGRKAAVTTEAFLKAAKGEFYPVSNNIYVKNTKKTKRYKKWKKYWLKYTMDDQYVKFNYETNSDGTYNVSIEACFCRFTKFSTSKSKVDYDWVTVEREFNNIKTLPTKIKLSGTVTLTYDYDDDRFVLVFSQKKKSGSSVTQFGSTVTFDRHYGND